ncbi:MAG: hypothetical protein AVDCRST_MAG20-2075, partial [uncultured Acidimicrobiales bacterium]
ERPGARAVRRADERARHQHRRPGDGPGQERDEGAGHRRGGRHPRRPHHRLVRSHGRDQR